MPQNKAQVISSYRQESSSSIQNYQWSIGQSHCVSYDIDGCFLLEDTDLQCPAGTYCQDTGFAVLLQPTLTPTQNPSLPSLVELRIVLHLQMSNDKLPYTHIFRHILVSVKMGYGLHARLETQNSLTPFISHFKVLSWKCRKYEARQSFQLRGRILLYSSTALGMECPKINGYFTWWTWLAGLSESWFPFEKWATAR